jgi:hypothetical protein
MQDVSGHLGEQGVRFLFITYTQRIIDVALGVRFLPVRLCSLSLSLSLLSLCLSMPLLPHSLYHLTAQYITDYDTQMHFKVLECLRERAHRKPSSRTSCGGRWLRKPIATESPNGKRAVPIRYPSFLFSFEHRDTIFRPIGFGSA